MKMAFLLLGIVAAGFTPARGDPTPAAAAAATATDAQFKARSAHQGGRMHDLVADRAYAGRSPRVTIVEFVGTASDEACNAMGEGFQQIQAAILRHHLEDKVRLLTISVDPLHRTPGVLADYARRMRADPKVWTLMSAQSPGALDETDAGLMSSAASRRSSALHLVDGQGRPAGTFEPGEPDAALDAAVRLMAQFRLL